MTKNANKNLGEFEILVLAAVLRLGEGAYGTRIKQEIESRTGRSTSLGALYATLSRLEAKKFVRSRLGEATAERGGRAKRYYMIEPLGEQLLNQSIRSLRNMTDGLVSWSMEV